MPRLIAFQWEMCKKLTIIVISIRCSLENDLVQKRKKALVSRKKTVEKQNYRQYKANEGAYAAIITPNSYKLGQIIDIGMEGLSFKYIDSNKGYKATRTQKEHSVFLNSVGCCVEDLPVNIVSDHEVTNTPSFSSLKIKKMRIKFINLNLTQWLDLDNYIRKNVTEKVENLPNQCFPDDH